MAESNIVRLPHEVNRDKHQTGPAEIRYLKSPEITQAMIIEAVTKELGDKYDIIITPEE